jgi:hypothetical protein
MTGTETEDTRHKPIRDEEPATLMLPPALIGVLLLVAVTLACVFYIAAQVVHTP